MDMSKFFEQGFHKLVTESNTRNHFTGGINYRRTLHPDWNVSELGDGIYQLRFSQRPILNFELTGDSELIKKLKTHGENWLWLQKVSKDSIRLPITSEIHSMALRVKNKESDEWEEEDGVGNFANGDQSVADMDHRDRNQY